MGHIWMLIPMMALSIPIITILLSFRQKTQETRLKELQLKKEMLELEIAKQNTQIKLLEQENKNLDKIIENRT
ncbi:MAG: hypothetical protein FWB83_00015 [Treponema sp.]|nr:hypothetical protein [Treponema sp.]